MKVNEKFLLARRNLSNTLIERESEVDLALTALLAKEHCLFVGPPGTAKSALCYAIMRFLDGKKSFEWLINKHTDVNEILGAIDFNAYKEGDHRHITHNKLPEAHVAFLDELLKGSTALLNTVLKILNERQFDNGLTVMHCPLQLCIAASNEWPDETESLQALFDRFLFRKTVQCVSLTDNITKLIFADDLTPDTGVTVSLAELNEAQVAAREMDWDPDALDKFAQILSSIREAGILVGDRRLRKSNMACKSFAWLNGHETVTKDDLEVLAHVLWVNPTEQPGKVQDIIRRIAKPSGLLVADLVVQAKDVMSKLAKPGGSAYLVSCAETADKLRNIAKSIDKIEGERAAIAKQMVVEMAKKLSKDTLATI
jgi:MoxR-like ATPase